MLNTIYADKFEQTITQSSTFTTRNEFIPNRSFVDILDLNIQKSIKQTSHCNYTIVTEICQRLNITLFIHLKTHFLC